MILMGIVITLVGFLLSVASLGLTESNGARLIIVLAGMAVSVTGILGVLNTHYLKNAIWKR